MTSDKAKKIKAIVKGTAPKSTFGTNPNDPWSAKYNVAESNDLDRYLKSRGINPAFVAKDTKIAHAKSGDFAKWKRDHQFEEVQTEQTTVTKHTPTEIRQQELKKKVEKHDEIGVVKSEAWDQPDYNQSIKARQAEADKKAKEETQKVNEMDYGNDDNSPPYDGHGYPKGGKPRGPDIYVKKAQKVKDVMKDAKKTLDKILGQQKEEIELDEGKMGDLAGEIGRHLDKHIDDYKIHGGAEHLGHKTIDTAKKIVKSHNLHPTHAQKFVNDYVEKRLAEDLGTMAGAAALGGAAAYGIGRLAGKMINKFDQKYDGTSRTTAKKHKDSCACEKCRGSDNSDLKKGVAEDLTNPNAKPDKVDRKKEPNARSERYYKNKEEKKKQGVAEDIWKGVSKAYPETKPQDVEKEKKIRAAKDSAILNAIRDKEAKEKKLRGEGRDVCPVCGCTPCNCTHISEDKFGKPTPSLEEIAKKHNISMEELKKAHEDGIKIESEHTDNKDIASEIARDHLNERPDYYKKLKQCVEDVFQDPQSATQTSFDMGTSTDDTIQNRKRQLSKSARIIKSIYKKKGMNEEMYDHEKEDKSVASYGKKPKMNTIDNGVSDEPDAVAVLSGGKTLTGEPRDDIEIDPKMKTRPNQPEDEVKLKNGEKDNKKDKQ